MKFKINQKVKLKVWTDPDDSEVSNPEEYGLILSIDKKSQTCCIRLDNEFLQDKHDDGLRNVPFDQIEEILK